LGDKKNIRPVNIPVIISGFDLTSGFQTKAQISNDSAMICLLLSHSWTPRGSSHSLSHPGSCRVTWAAHRFGLPDLTSCSLTVLDSFVCLCILVLHPSCIVNGLVRLRAIWMT